MLLSDVYKSGFCFLGLLCYLQQETNEATHGFIYATVIVHTHICRYFVNKFP